METSSGRRRRQRHTHHSRIAPCEELLRRELTSSPRFPAPHGDSISISVVKFSYGLPDNLAAVSGRLVLHRTYVRLDMM